jgi:DNA-directed RNA polymerase specialized sigma24 family protein
MRSDDRDADPCSTTLAPVERAVFVLREVFDLPYADIAAVVVT